MESSLVPEEVCINFEVEFTTGTALTSITTVAVPSIHR